MKSRVDRTLLRPTPMCREKWSKLTTSTIAIWLSETVLISGTYSNTVSILITFKSAQRTHVFITEKLCNEMLSYLWLQTKMKRSFNRGFMWKKQTTIRLRWTLPKTVYSSGSLIPVLLRVRHCFGLPHKTNEFSPSRDRYIYYRLSIWILLPRRKSSECYNETYEKEQCS